MQLDARLSLSIVVLLLVGAAKARPTFDKIAGALIDVLDDRPQYYPAPPPPRPGYAYGPGPLIHEGYDQGYDYYYGGGYGHGYQQGPPPGAYGYYPPPQRPAPSAGYYPHRPQEPYGHPHRPQEPYGHPHRDRGYSQGYGRSVGPVGTPPASTGGYKQRGY
ncbi:basic salivary proline-rich protein 3 [Drosophila obscura]|uniref:basic salivary proline-rich protein 3 n=1 Tax=Drosophila obscura TaxID=7282 RepID=UPI001BB286BF|nr:basic salivary proline-rich protein 3 [Drosophila obscura]